MGIFKKWRAKRQAKKLAKIEAEKKELAKEQEKLQQKEAEIKGVDPKRVEEVKSSKPKETVKPKPKTTTKKEVTSKNSEKEGPAKYHVSQNKDEKSEYFKEWRVRKEGSNKTIKYFKTQLEAIDYANHLAEQAGSSIVIHKLDGTIRKQDYTK